MCIRDSRQPIYMIHEAAGFFYFFSFRSKRKFPSYRASSFSAQGTFLVAIKSTPKPNRSFTTMSPIAVSYTHLGVVVFLYRHISWFSLRPTIETKLPDGVLACAADANPPLLQGHTHLSDPIQHLVFGRDHPKSSMPQHRLYKAGRGWIHCHALQLMNTFLFQ